MSAGMIPLVNTQAKSELVVLSSAQSPQKNDELNTVSFFLDESIEAPEQHFVAKLSLNSMMFFNSFNTINSTNNTLKVLSVWADTTVTPNVYYDGLNTIKLPPGHYDATSFATAIQPLLITAPSNGPGGFSYGFPTIVANTNTSNFTITGYSLATLQGNGTAAHSYRGFYLIYDTDTKPLMNIMGFGEETESGYLKDISPINEAATEGLEGVGFAYTGAGAAPVIARSNNPIVTTTVDPPTINPNNLFDFVPVQALEVSINGIRADIKTGANLSRGTTIAVVPVTGNFGTACNFFPPNPFKNALTGLQLSAITINVRNASTGALVDFQGVDWIINLEVEWFEPQTTEESDAALSGRQTKVLPLFHNNNHDHLLPFSGTKNKKRKGGIFT